MLDKTVPYAKLYMHRPAGTPIPHFPLPQGYRFSMYKKGDEKDWTRIETSVGEFESEFAALMHFREKYSPHLDELCRRLLFIETDDGKKVATTNAWWAHIKCEKRAWIRLRRDDNVERRAWIHWVGVDPAYQGKGLGKAIVSRALEIMCQIEGDTDIYLCTQTWSYKAIDIYKKCGFEPTDEAVLYDRQHRKDYEKALTILSQLNNENQRRNYNEKSINHRGF